MTDRREILERYLTARLQVLSLWQPWATLLVAPDPAHDGRPAKPHETRSWWPRGPLPTVAIHATKTLTKESRESLRDDRFRAALKRCGFYPGDPGPLLSGRMQSTYKPLPLGAIIGVGTVTSAWPTSQTPPAHEDDAAFGDFGPDRCAWRFAGVVMLPEPVRFTGRQEALYDVDLYAREAINLQIGVLLAASTPTVGADSAPS